jgi:Ca-activated chloride channel family protein
MKTSSMSARFQSVLAACVLASGAGGLRADGLIVVHRPPPGFVPAAHVPYAFAPLEVKYHHVTVKIADQVAVTEVDQVFHNPNAQRLEGDYLFPIPRGAQIDAFSMDVNGKMTEAELLDADKARKIYEDIVRRMKDPALLEYAGQGLFKVRIFPIEPRSDKRVRLKYTQLLRADGGLFGYTYPLNTEKFSAQPIKEVSVKVEIETKQPLKAVYCASHTVEVKRGGDRRAVVGFETRDARPDTDFQVFYSVEAKSDVGINVLTYQDGADAEGGYFALMAAPSEAMADDRVVRKDVVFVLDTSGSMSSDGKLDQAKRALAFCLQNLNDGDRFELVRFSTEAEALFGQLRDASGENRKKADEFVRSLKPIGGTAIEEALMAALGPADGPADKDRPCVVIFLTDGRPTVGTTDEKALLEKLVKRLDGRTIRVFCFGIGTDVNTHLLDSIAEKTRAASQYVLPQEDLELKLSSFYAKINLPVLANLELVFSGPVRFSKMYPSVLPDLFKGDQLLVIGRYRGDGDAAVTIKGTVNGRAMSFTHEAAFASKSTESAFLPRLWATRRVGFLLDEIRLRGESKELRDEVADLARRYGIVTPYTAYLIVEDEKRRDVAMDARTLQVFAGNASAQAESTRMYDEVRLSKSGDAAVGGAQALDRLRRAANAAAPAEANAFAWRGQTGRSAEGAETVRATMQNQQVRHVRGRTFYQNGAQWVDALAQTRPSARRVQVRFNSDEYFDLARRNADVSQWLSLGRNMQVLVADTLYEVVE